MFVAALLSGLLLAQNADLDRLRLQSLQQQNMQAQEQQNVLRRNDADMAQALSDRHAYRTEQALRTTRPAGAVLTDPKAPSQITSEAEVMRRIQDEELAAGNARLRAIAPAAR